MASGPWQAYDPGWLIDLVRQQAGPEDAWIAEALRCCNRALRTFDRDVRAETYYFVDPSEPNQPGSAWQYQESVVLEMEDRGVVVDVSRDRRVLGVEILWSPGRGPSS